jgi:protein DJ-1
MTKRALVILAEGAEEMETIITVDVLRRAGVEVVLAGLDTETPVTCSRGVRLLPDASLEAVADPASFDVVVLPGGAEGARRLGASARVGELLREREQSGRLVAAICAAPAAFATHRVFRGRALTSHPSVTAVLADHATWCPGRVVEDEGLVTSQGPGTTFDFALALVRHLCGAEREAEVRGPMRLDA